MSTCDGTFEQKLARLIGNDEEPFSMECSIITGYLFSCKDRLQQAGREENESIDFS